MLYDFQALAQVFIPFGVVLLLFGVLYVTVTLHKKKSLKEALKEDYLVILEIASALLVLVTLLEMQMERVQAYKPFLVLGTGSGACEYQLNDADDEKQYAVFIHNLSDPDLSGDVVIPIRNIGMGVANNLSMEFTIDFDANSKRYFLFEEKYPAFSLDRYRGKHIKVDAEYIRSNTFKDSIGIGDESERTYQTFILPDNQEVLYVSIPTGYLSAIRHYFAYCLDIDVPPLYFTIEYEDIQGIKYEQNFYLSVSMGYSNAATVSGGHVIRYTFTPKKGQDVQYGGSAQDEFPEPFDYSVFQRAEENSEPGT